MYNFKYYIFRINNEPEVILNASENKGDMGRKIISLFSRLMYVYHIHPEGSFHSRYNLISYDYYYRIGFRISVKRHSTIIIKEDCHIKNYEICDYTAPYGVYFIDLV